EPVMFLSMLTRSRRHMLRSCAALLLVLPSCANLSFQRDTETSGTFESSGFAVTLISFDLPKSAMMIARENASDTNLPTTIVSDTAVFPSLGSFDWIVDVVGMRDARVRGTWGATPKDAGNGS